MIMKLLISLTLIFPAVSILFGYFIGNLISKKANKINRT